MRLTLLAFVASLMLSSTALGGTFDGRWDDFTSRTNYRYRDSRPTRYYGASAGRTRRSVRFHTGRISPSGRYRGVTVNPHTRRYRVHWGKIDW